MAEERELARWGRASPAEHVLGGAAGKAARDAEGAGGQCAWWSYEGMETGGRYIGLWMASNATQGAGALSLRKWELWEDQGARWTGEVRGLTVLL